MTMSHARETSHGPSPHDDADGKPDDDKPVDRKKQGGGQGEIRHSE